MRNSCFDTNVDFFLKFSSSVDETNYIEANGVILYNPGKNCKV